MKFMEYYCLNVRIAKEELSNGEPAAFKIGSGSMTGVASDTFSFLDMTLEDLSAKGGGGLRQMHHYVTINQGKPY